ncbi:hypothetical protein, variant 2 [Verruconis gallopava]|nr:hypothetical protein, variant 1 [Verruconis gallopava]XP_016214890.1 hypothetical protein, variant 2 [Verruconis gallopava]KIW05020.1 hypothetical protein, variant 1 [Verruconis gallopava]KIW05021.1 hypothetical protein, variant 2 [Verruconis gallopava]
MAGETKAPQLIASVSVFLPLAIAAVVMRIWVRIKMIRNFGWDDVMMVVALLNFAMYCSALMVIVANGGGTHLAHLKNIRLGIIFTVVAEVSYLTTILFLKISLGLFFLRVVQSKWQRRAIYGVVIMSTLIQAYHALFYIFACGNPRYYPEHILADKCIPGRIQVDLAYEQAAVTTATDLFFALIPIPLLWDTTLDRRSKLSVAFVLLLGTAGIVCSVVRFKYINGLGSMHDFFWTAANISLWSLFEMATGIIAGSLATMRPLFKRLMYKARTITQVGKTRKSGDTGHDASRTRMLSKKKSYGSSTSKSQNAMSMWSKSVDPNRSYAATITGGCDHDDTDSLSDFDEERGAQLVNLRDENIYSKDIWSKDPERSRIWPFDDSQSIRKMVQVEVRSSQESEQPWAAANTESWNARMQAILRPPPRIRKGSKDDDSIPEWEKLPDLIPPSRKGSSDSQSRDPPLVRITTR